MWDELYEKHYPELLRYAAAACKNQAEAEDVAQEVFLKALQNADTFEDLGPNQRRAWLFRALKNLMCEDTAYIEPGIQQTENELVLKLLTPEDRLLFTLRYLEGYNASEISDMLNMPPGTVRARLSRCRVLLKKSMEL